MRLIYKNIFRPNDSVICLATIKFCDGAMHKKGDVITITEETLAYYNLHTDKYAIYEKNLTSPQNSSKID